MASELNRAQLEAVRHEGGPLAVLAGPGTGKTRVIVHRVADLVERRGVEPDSLLVVTFTVKATEELRARLSALIGPERASLVRAHTFNGYGMRLVQRFADVLGLPPRLMMIDKAQATRLIRSIVLERGLYQRSRGEGLGSLAADLLGSFEALANMGKTPEDCWAFAREWVARAADDAERARAGEFRERAEAYGAYVTTRVTRGWLSYADQILLPIRLLRESASVRAIVSGELREVIVDEFQDCNNCQIELLSLLAGPGARGRGGSVDLTVVGDDDQAIYGFRGSDDRTFQRFARGWPGARTISLEENYRSAPEIVAVANSVIVRSPGRFAPEKRVQAVSREAGSTEIVDLTDDSNAGEVIAAMLREMRAAGGSPEWRKIAVLARSHTDLDRVERALKLEGIPTHRRLEKNVLDEDGVADVLAWARWLLDPGASWEARRVLSRPPFGVSPSALLEDEVAYKAAISKAGEEHGDPGPFAPWLALRRPESGPIARASALWASLREDVAGLRGEEAIWKIMVATDPAHADLLPGRDRAARVTALVALLTLARDKQPRLSPPGDLGSLMSHLDELAALRDLRPSPGLGDVDEDGADETGEDEGLGRVQLMTAHAAKGLEFHTVFVPRVCPQYGFPKTAHKDEGWTPPAGLDDRPGGMNAVSARLEEERRLFYVAVTRAQRRLVLLAKKNKKASSSTHYLDELRGPGGAPTVARAESDVLDAAGKAATAPGLSRAGDGVGGVTDVEGALAEARGRARAGAAWALEQATTDLQGAREGLSLAAERFAAIGAMSRGEGTSAWAEGSDPVLRELASRLSLGAKASGGFTPRAMTAPLRLSYTRVNGYLNCPRCFYLRECMGLPEPSTPSLGLGSVAHDVLAKFFDRVRNADAEGSAPPGAEELARMGRAGYMASLPEGVPASREDLDVLLAQLRGVLEGLHKPTDHIVEIERAIRVPWILDGVEHSLEAKVDRVDLLPDGGYRIVDYKTSLRPTKKHLTPEADDLQMGVYAMALEHLMGAPVKGVAEYWLLATGQRGSISLEEIDVTAVRAVIDEAARGMLTGAFDRKDKCEGPCGLLG